MSNPKKTIGKSIFFSHIKIILIFVVLTSIVFNICLRIYVRNQTKTQLTSAAGLVKKSVNLELFSRDTVSNTAKEDNKLIKSVLAVNRILKQSQTFLDVNYAVVGKRNNLIYPANDSSEEYELISAYILPIMQRRNITTAKINKNKIVNFAVNREKYIVLLYPIKSESDKVGYLLLYSSLNKTNKMIFTVNMVLLSILLVTSIIALAISRDVSKKISGPISELGTYARNIGDRQYDVKIPMYEDDEIGQLAETMNSMTNKLSAYDNTMKTFLQNASHEFRTPLMSIQGYAEGIKYDVVEDKEAAADIIIEESKRLTELVEDLLYLSKIDSMQEDINMEELNMEDIIRSSIERVNGIAVKNQKVIHFACNDKDMIYHGDDEKLTRALINILGNCLRFANKNIQVAAQKENSRIVILIKDDGPGFDTGDIVNLFSRFYKGKGGNYGLGLAITKSILEKHGANITAGNNKEGGAFFKITL
jgi:signal transduction histidine kinase